MLTTTPPAQITDNLLMLGTGAYPLYLFRGKREAAIFEGGTGPMGPLLREQLQEQQIPADIVKQVIVTHAHPDHVMAVPLFREMFPGVEILASAAAAKTMSAEKAVSLFCKIDGALTDSLLKAGQIGEQHKPEPLGEMRIAVDRLLKEGDAVTIEGTAFAVLETPGHSDCSLSFHQPEAGILIVSDATGYYVPEHDAWWPNYFGGYDGYLGSMRRLREIGAEILCLSHNAVIQGADEVKGYFDRDIAATEAYHERIIGEIESGKTVRRLAEELGSEIYEKTQLLPLDFFQKNCGVLVKQSLKREGIDPEEKK